MERSPKDSGCVILRFLMLDVYFGKHNGLMSTNQAAPHNVCTAGLCSWLRSISATSLKPRHLPSLALPLTTHDNHPG